MEKDQPVLLHLTDARRKGGGKWRRLMLLWGLFTPEDFISHKDRVQKMLRATSCLDQSFSSFQCARSETLQLMTGALWCKVTLQSALPPPYLSQCPCKERRIGLKENEIFDVYKQTDKKYLPYDAVHLSCASALKAWEAKSNMARPIPWAQVPHPAGDVLPPWKPDPDATVLSDPTPRHSCCWRGQQRKCWVKTIVPALQLTDVREGDAGRKAFRYPIKELFSTVSPSSRPCKWRIAMPLVLPLLLPLSLPPLLPLPLLWGRGELTPPPKLPSKAIAKNLGTLEKNTECQRNKILEDKTGVLADCRISSQPTFGACDGQQPDDSFLVGKLAALAQAVGPTSPAAQPPRGSIMQPGFADLTSPASAFNTTVNTQLTFGDMPGVLPIGTSTATGFGVATRMSSTGDSSSLFANNFRPTCVSGTCSPYRWWELWDQCVYPRSHSVTGIQSTQLWGRTEGAPSTTSAPPFGQITWDPSGHSMAVAVKGASAMPVFGHTSGSTLNLSTWGPPVQNTDLGQSSSHIPTSPREDGFGIHVLASRETKEEKAHACSAFELKILIRQTFNKCMQNQVYFVMLTGLEEKEGILNLFHTEMEALSCGYTGEIQLLCSEILSNVEILRPCAVVECCKGVASKRYKGVAVKSEPKESPIYNILYPLPQLGESQPFLHWSTVWTTLRDGALRQLNMQPFGPRGLKGDFESVKP
ncbi:hypothetical protein HPG69_007677 [Diceros bicornis minor]|uniref:Uncharacterized protein n=1 Tax=Diceros bicornis minor TaxID=77932 RepID=A0A7J7EAA8_DICBM|nr:hypothetical protein HPG69_007677 [Diceros bicornis minor]